MRTLETGQERVQRICDELRRKTLEPAEQEAKQLIEAAHARADAIQKEAEALAAQRLEQVHKQIEQERKVAQTALKQAIIQAVETLRQQIEQHLFHQELHSLLAHTMNDSHLIANLINGIVKAIEKEGLAADLSIVIPRLVPAEAITRLLISQVANRLKDQPLELGEFAGGVQLKLQDRHLMIDISDRAVQELLSHYLRKDFRELLFS